MKTDISCDSWQLVATSCTADVGLYLHIPFCRTKCDYCNFYVVPGGHPLAERLIDAMCREILDLDMAGAIQTVYFGGGSPSFLSPEQIGRLCAALRAVGIGVEEMTLEANPDEVDVERLAAWREGGVTRLSIGAQSFHNPELRWLTRSYDAGRIRQAVKSAREAGFDNINLDLIFALPGSTRESWTATLQQGLSLEPEHISAYSLTVEKGTKLFQQVRRGRVRPLEEEHDREQYETAITMLTDAGYEQYEISNFARPGYPCRHNQGYWQGWPYVGIGPGACGYRDGRRVAHIAGIRPYVEAVEAGSSVVAQSEVIDGPDRVCEAAVLRLRQTAGIDRLEFRREFGADPVEFFAAAVEQHIQLSNLAVTDERIRLTQQALPIADAVLCDFASI